MNHKQQWTEEMQHAARTLVAIRQCVAPSPRQEAWAQSTERALRLLAEHVSGVRQSQQAAKQLLRDQDGQSHSG